MTAAVAELGRAHPLAGVLGVLAVELLLGVRGDRQDGRGAVVEEPVLQGPGRPLVRQRLLCGESRKVCLEVVAAAVCPVDRASQGRPAGIGDQAVVHAPRELSPEVYRLRRRERR